jgi:DNA-binding PadR family transcriptional regulator
VDSQPLEVVSLSTAALNATAASLLGLLDDCGELTGGDLLRVAQLRIGSYWSLTRSQVYRELGALADAGYIQAGERGPRDARPFRLTAAGRAAFLEWLHDEVPRESVRNGLLLLVAFGRHLPAGRLAEILDTYHQAHVQQLAAYRELDERLAEAGADPYVRATLSFGLHYEQAVLDWLASLPDDVRDGSARPVVSWDGFAG